MRCFLKRPRNSNWINRLRGLFSSQKDLETIETIETEKPEIPETLNILEVANYVVWFCFDRVDPPTRLTLNCYLWLMNEYTLRTTGNPIAPDAVFELDGRYLGCIALKKEYFPGPIIPWGKRPDTERISGILKLDWFLEGLMKFNLENPFRLLELCREKDFDAVYNNLIDYLK